MVVKGGLHSIGRPPSARFVPESHLAPQRVVAVDEGVGLDLQLFADGGFRWTVPAVDLGPHCSDDGPRPTIDERYWLATRRRRAVLGLLPRGRP
jgi:hypothetical protein